MSVRIMLPMRAIVRPCGPFFLTVQKEHRRSAVHFLLGCTLPTALFPTFFHHYIFPLPYFLIRGLPLQCVDNGIKVGLNGD